MARFSCNVFPNFLHWGNQKTGLTFYNILEVYVILKLWRILAAVSFKTGTANFRVILG